MKDLRKKSYAKAFNGLMCSKHKAYGCFDCAEKAYLPLKKQKKKYSV